MPDHMKLHILNGHKTDCGEIILGLRVSVKFTEIGINSRSIFLRIDSFYVIIPHFS